MAWDRREDTRTKETSGGPLSPSHPTQQCSSPTWEGVPEGQMGDGGSEKAVKKSPANLELSTDHGQALFSVLFIN